MGGEEGATGENVRNISSEDEEEKEEEEEEHGEKEYLMDEEQGSKGTLQISKLMEQIAKAQSIVGESGAQQRDGKDGVEALSQLLDQLYTPGTSEARQAASQEKRVGPEQPSELISERRKPVTPRSPPSSTALAQLSDRLTALESAIGLSQMELNDSTKPILPALSSLESQISVLTSLFSPDTATSLHTTTSANALALPSSTPADQGLATTNPVPALVNIDSLNMRVRSLTRDSQTLTQARKNATQSLNELMQARYHAATTATRQEMLDGSGIGGSYLTGANGASSVGSPNPPENSSHPPVQPTQLGQQQSQQQGQLLQPDLLSSSSSISAVHSLHSTLPHLHSLTPILPPLISRLRSLQTIHAGAAEARADLDELERGLDGLSSEAGQWEEALTRVEALNRTENGREGADGGNITNGGKGTTEERQQSDEAPVDRTGFKLLLERILQVENRLDETYTRGQK